MVLSLEIKRYKRVTVMSHVYSTIICFVKQYEAKVLNKKIVIKWVAMFENVITMLNAFLKLCKRAAFGLFPSCKLFN